LPGKPALSSGETWPGRGIAVFYGLLGIQRQSIVQADFVIHADWVIPVEPSVVLERHSVAVAEGRISAIAPRETAERQIEARETVHLPGHCLIPGLINAHTHSAMSLVWPTTCR
jgi:adenine deaminase